MEKMCPLMITEEGNVMRRANSWADEFDILFIDNPIGVGYST